MNKDIFVKQYLKNVSKNLICPKKIKIELLAGLYQEINDSSISEWSIEILRELYGSEKVVAEEFMQNWDEDEQNKYLKHRNRIRYLTAAILIIIVLAMFLFLLELILRLTWIQPTQVIDTITISAPYTLGD